MIISGHQPSYLPWYGFFEKIHKSDVFVFHDIAQFEKKGFLNRNRIKTSQGVSWLTVPMQMKNYKEIPLNKLKIDNTQDWERKHWKTVRINYSNAPYFNVYKDYLEGFYSEKWDNLNSLNMNFIHFIIRELNIDTELYYASELEGITGKKSDFVLELCQKFNASTYYSGSLGQDYLIESDFEHENIEIMYQRIREYSYPQLFGEFIPHLSMLDILLNCGPEETEKLIKGV
ncbi:MULTISPECIES: WbqC family protein [unclassified Bacillus (in: firmicutes)]|uniref:WbqC family protein n=1 Tax=unclassified Bacillus (in: firmicutes) TaxID=185979 RepID=UPI00191304E1|nr:WbqC family protein [Bacillus sp. TH12]MBK5503168.1 WbqC family protein [Bacillus sp. TH12]QWI78214.1 WbqC family protein [Bacillus mycoides]